MRSTISLSVLSLALAAGHALAGPELIESSREIRAGADGPGDPGYSETQSASGAGQFQDSLAAGGFVNGANTSASAGQTSDVFFDGGALRLTGTGSSGLAAIANGNGPFGVAAVSLFTSTFRLDGPGSIEMLWSFGAAGDEFNPITSGTSSIRLTNETLGISVFSEAIDAGTDAGFFQASLPAGEYTLLALASNVAFQGNDGSGFVPLGGNTTLSSSWGVNATIVPAPTSAALLSLGLVRAARRR